MSVHISGSFINLSPFCFFILPWQVPTLQALFLGLRLRPISVSVPYVGSPCFHQEIPNPQADSTLLSRFRHWGTIHQPERQLMFTHRPLIYHSLPGNIGGIYWGFFWKWLFFFYKFPKIRFLVTCWSSTKLVLLVDQQAQCQGRPIPCTLSTLVLLREVERGLSWCVYLGRRYKCPLLGIGESRCLFPLCQNY